MLKVQFDDYGAEIELERDGQKQFKYLSFPKFQQLILRQYKFDTGLLPPNALAYKRTASGELSVSDLTNSTKLT